MPNSDLSGIIAASTTPVDAAFDIDTIRLAGHCERMLDGGCRYVSTFGTTGEGVSLSTDQKIGALRALGANGVRLDRHIPCIMSACIDDAARMVGAASALGCRAVLVLPPFYYDAPSHEGVAAFFEAMLARAGRPAIDILLYNIPRYTGVSFVPGLVELLKARIGCAIVGIKDSTGSVENGIMLARRFPDLSIFTGDDRVLPSLVVAGGAGLIGGLPNLFPDDLRRIYEDPDGPETRQLRDRQAERIAAVAAHGDLRAVKFALARRYGDPAWARTLPPLTPLTDAEAPAVLTVPGSPEMAAGGGPANAPDTEV